MSEDHVVSFSLEVNVDEAYASIRRLQTVLFRSIALLRRLGLPEQMDNAIRKMQQAIMVINQLRLALAALQAARAASGDPIAIAQLGVAVGAFMFTANDFANEVAAG